MLQQKTWPLFLALVGVFWLAPKGLAQSLAAPGASAPSAPSDVHSLDTAIRIHPKVFGNLHPSMVAEVSRAICENFASNLKQKEGPRGMGIFVKNTECVVTENPDTVLKPNVWTLRLGSPEAGFLPITMCRPINFAANSKQEKCDVQLKVSMNPKHADRVLAHPLMARLLSGYILDWTPFQSKLTANLVSPTNTKAISLKEENANAAPFAIPQTSYNLLPISVSLDAKNGLFNVKVVKSESLSKLANDGKTWLANANGRGNHDAAFQKQIAKALASLAPAFNKQDFNSRNAQKIVGRPERAFAKYRLSHLKKNEFEFGVKGGGIYSNTANSNVTSQQYRGEFAVHKGKWLNAWFDASYMASKYKLSWQLSGASEASSNIKSSGSLSNVRATGGFGFRFLWESDHAVAIFPVLGFASMSWKTFNDTASVVDFSDTIRQSGLLYGGAIEYQSPERWFVNLRSRVEFQMQPALTMYGIKNEFALRLPRSAQFVSTATKASVAWLVPFFDAAQLNISAVSGQGAAAQQVQISMVDATLGLGLRLEWL
jgi:hypothetical protein